jgi:long-subunit acyl-CoA synthetase (AMP-forming)
MIVDEPFTVGFSLIGYLYMIDKISCLELDNIFFLVQIDNGLMTATMKIRRDKVTDKYRREIEVRYEVRVRVL